jgi:pimeloyl-ACP methyl ester carboxylesterase
LSYNTYLPSASGQIHVRVDGEGPPLVLLAPSPRSSLYFHPLLPFLHGHQTLAIDTPGFGLSTALPAEWTMEALADIIAEALQADGRGPVDIVGVHTGNKIGSALAARHPSLVRSVSIVGMSHSLVLDEDQRTNAFAAYSPSPDSVRNAGAGATQERMSHTLQDAGATLDRARQALASDGVERARAIASFAVDLITGADCYDALYRANYAFDWHAAMAQIERPTLILELLTPQEEHLGEQASLIGGVVRGATVRTLHGSDRQLINHEPAKLAGVITEFLDTLETKDGIPA